MGFPAGALPASEHPSANLTDDAFNRNLELGALLSGFGGILAEPTGADSKSAFISA
jgi:hypothetical protein